MESCLTKHPMFFPRIFLWELIFFCSLANAQLTRPGRPLSPDFAGLKKLIVYEFQVSGEEKMKARNKPDASLLKPARSGILIDTDYNPENSGTWDTLRDGTRIWRCGFKVGDARALSLIFKPYQVKSGVRIFIYDPLQQIILGAFSDLNNKPEQVLATGHIQGEILILEVQVPRFDDSPGNITISGIGCDFSDVPDQKSLKDGWFGLSGNCNMDINCQNLSGYQVVKNAVVRIVYRGGERCTGTLMNNTRQDGKNYVLTAEHCINTEADANTAVFYFSYESPFCNGPDGSNAKSVSGATLRATATKLDFSLLELLEPVPFHYHPYYAGWDINMNPPLSAYCIHHPQGDVKKISIENDPLTVATFGDLYERNTHWLVSHWDTGTTEAGSSGAGLFDSNGRIRGSLTGGQASCGNSVNDYFQMLGHEWKDYSSPGNQLAYWLDPLDIRKSFLNGFDPFAGFWESGDTLSNIRPGEKLVTDISNLAWGSWSGHNSLSLSQFAEHFSSVHPKKVLGVILNVAQNDILHQSSHLRLKIWEDQGLPGQVIYEQDVPLADLSAHITNFLEFDSIVSTADTFFAGYELFYPDPADTFSTFMADNRLTGVYNTSYVFDGRWQSLDNYTGGLIHSSFCIMPVVFDSIPGNSPQFQFTSDIMIFPNPTADYCWIEFKKMIADPVKLAVYSLRGELITESEYGPYQQSVRIETTGFRNGVYIIRVRQGNHIHIAKMIVLR